MASKRTSQTARNWSVGIDQIFYRDRHIVQVAVLLEPQELLNWEDFHYRFYELKKGVGYFCVIDENCVTDEDVANK